MKSSVELSSIGGQHLASPASSPPPPSAEDAGVDEGPAPQLAIRSDGAILLSIEELGNRDLTGLTLWTAVVLPNEKAAFARERTANSAQETAAHLAGRFPLKS